MLAKLRPLMATAARAKPAPAVSFSTAAAEAAEGDGHVQYNHTDACHHLRWTAKESYEYMYARPWSRVVDFYAELVCTGAGAAGLADLFGKDEIDYTLDANRDDCTPPSEKQASMKPSKDRGGRWERVTFKIVLSYHGGSFDGWQKQPGLNTVQGLVEKHLGQFVDEKKAKQLEARSLPIEGCAIVAGRTDKGVTALQQVCSFYTWRKDVKSRDIKDAINKATPDKLRLLHVSEVSREFHPNFAAKWRRYLYIFPLDEDAKPISGEEQPSKILEGSEYNIKPQSFNVVKVDKIIRQLEGKSLSYKMFARDTQASRSVGPPTECFMFHSRASVVKLHSADENCEEGMRAICIELVANRFLRKMVRVLVATAIREAAAGAEEDALLNLMEATCRRATAPPAPPEGLCLVDVGYDDFNRQRCFIVD
ncbi:tRNA pseudouridine synthase A isoform X2 [Oryza brachyantha]|uniref:tRNA pseudouridine synthase A isoform X2 n=1 Tax=Oryza brachyantha TaxID=4533 RepID=UPI001ADD029A|nr:tRNA pseudouridine synthase A isoform X2 [Oryza brachyantha]